MVLALRIQRCERSVRSCCQSENADGKYCAERRLGRGGNRYAAEVGNCRDERNDGRLELAYNVLIQAKNYAAHHVEQAFEKAVSGGVEQVEVAIDQRRDCGR